MKIEATFAADDPWNGNQPTTFTIEDYVRSEHRQVSPDYKPPGRDFERGLRSGIDGVEHPVPDSLGELWRAQRVPAVALPQLLKDIEPSLRGSDYPVMLRNRARSFLVGVLGFLYAMILLLVVPSVIQGDWSLPVGGLLLLVAALACGGTYYVVVHRSLLRRKQQMKWLLDKATASRP